MQSGSHNTKTTSILTEMATENYNRQVNVRIAANISNVEKYQIHFVEKGDSATFWKLNSNLNICLIFTRILKAEPLETQFRSKHLLDFYTYFRGRARLFFFFNNFCGKIIF